MRTEISPKKILNDYEDKLRFVSKFFENAVKIFRGYLGLNKDVLVDAEKTLREKINNAELDNSSILNVADDEVYKNMTGGGKRKAGEADAAATAPVIEPPNTAADFLRHRRRKRGLLNKRGEKIARGAEAAGVAVGMDVDSDINKILNLIEERKNYGISYEDLNNIELLINVCENYNFGLTTTTIKDKLKVIYESTMKQDADAAAACAAAAAAAPAAAAAAASAADDGDDGDDGSGADDGDDDDDGSGGDVMLDAAASYEEWYNTNKDNIIKSSFFRLCEGYYNYTEHIEIARFIVSIKYIIDADLFTLKEDAPVRMGDVVQDPDQDPSVEKAIEYLKGLMTSDPSPISELSVYDEEFLETALRSLLSIIISNKLEEKATLFDTEEQAKNRQPEDVYTRFQYVQLADLLASVPGGAEELERRRAAKRRRRGGATQRIRCKHASKSERLKKKVSRKRKRKRKYTKRRGKLVKNIKASKRKRKRKKKYTR